MTQGFNVILKIIINLFYTHIAALDEFASYVKLNY